MAEKGNRELWEAEEQNPHPLRPLRTEDLPPPEEPLWLLRVPHRPNPQVGVRTSQRMTELLNVTHAC
ncbi:60S ribosomal protein L37-1-like [Iris pallida]|uniref:60S ribosomal protein L37-1-like n=1 Tax=Iris pallida TaxID=29817 RepID=A0AAX6DRZ8_IRIPA|nr:60S ribosomal protein L37-1-like [Iris pallida]